MKIHESINAQKIIPIIVFALAVVACVWLVFTMANFRTFSYMKFFVLLAGGTFVIVILAQKNTLKTTTVALLLLLPVIGLGLPPRRLGLSFFDLFALLIVCLLFNNVYWQKKRINLIPDKYVVVFLLSTLPSVFLGISPSTSMISFLQIILCYAFFVCVRWYLSEYGEMANLIKYLTYALLVVSIGVIFEELTGINLSMSSKNLNAFSVYTGVTRSAGFFQDPQKAAQFVAVCLVFLTVLLCQDVVVKRKEKLFIYTTIVLSCPALLLTVSRASIISGFLVVLLAFLFFNKNKRSKMLVFVILPIVVVIILANTDFFRSVYSETPLAERMMNIRSNTEGRYEIWKDSRIIFQKHPLTGIGPGNYQEFLMRRYPSLRAVKATGGYVPIQPENGYLKILYETGLIGFAGFVIFLFGLGTKLSQKIVLIGVDSTEKTSLAAGFGIIAFSIPFITLFTVSDARNSVLFIILYGILSFVPEKRTFGSVRPA